MGNVTIRGIPDDAWHATHHTCTIALLSIPSMHVQMHNFQDVPYACRTIPRLDDLARRKGMHKPSPLKAMNTSACLILRDPDSAPSAGTRFHRVVFTLSLFLLYLSTCPSTPLHVRSRVHAHHCIHSIPYSDCIYTKTRKRRQGWGTARACKLRHINIPLLLCWPDFRTASLLSPWPFTLYILHLHVFHRHTRRPTLYTVDDIDTCIRRTDDRDR